MNTSQISIYKSNERQFQYRIEMSSQREMISNRYVYYEYQGEIYILDTRTDTNQVHGSGIWNDVGVELGRDVYINLPYITRVIPEELYIRTIKLYIPNDSLEVYLSNVLYNITLSTFINGVRVNLGSQLISSMNAIATTPIRANSRRYDECISIDIIDPFSILYGDEWSRFRSVLCNGDTTNRDGSSLYIELTPVVHGENYSELPGYRGGSCSIPVVQDINQPFIKLSIDIKPHTTPSISMSLLFNEVYAGDIVLYLQETYDIDITGCDIYYEIVLKDENSIYKTATYTSSNYEISHSFLKSEFSFNDWSEYKDGLSLKSSISIRSGEDEVFQVVSDEIPFIEELFKYFITTDIDGVLGRYTYNGFLNLNYIHMQNYQLDVVNKINKTVVTVNRPDDYKSNIMKPIFIRTSTLSDLYIHPSIMESISIDLNAYKSKVDTFYLRVEGVDFVEIGRVPSGVVFKVNGSQLPNAQTSGIYYILNEDYELVTTGNYTYIQ